MKIDWKQISSLRPPDADPPATTVTSTAVKATAVRRTAATKDRPSPPPKTAAVHTTTAVETTAVSATTAAHTTAVVEEVAGFLRLPNTILFSIYPRLRPAERVVFEELYLHTHGFGRNPAVVSQKRIAARLAVEEKFVIRHIRALVAKGFVRRLGAEFGARDRGTRFDVWPFGAPETTVKKTAAVDRTAAVDVTDMKESIKDEKEMDLYEVRTLVARLVEVRRGDRYSRDALVRDIETTITATGRRASSETIARAVGPYQEHL